ncbi:peptidoglycan-associated lipoprotein Pal [Ideonella sp.]|uniref:peptidoglycan-associated lipoprotein Pal n=1 Tax=Ideonella sp. TaxID=1929293 RepID=UPI0035B35530
MYLKPSLARLNHRVLLPLALAALLGACSSTPEAPKPPAPEATAKPAAAAPKPAAATAPAAAASVLPAHLDPKSAISTQRSVYFDFDESLVKPEFVRLLELHGKYLMSNPALAIRIEGNTDERGSPEYNLALGQKRAEAVRNALTLYGAKDNQMEAVSWGEEKPRAPGHDEAQWSQNRRADLQYPTK